MFARCFLPYVKRIPLLVSRYCLSPSFNVSLLAFVRFLLCGGIIRGIIHVCGSDGELKSNRLIHFAQIEPEIEPF